MMPDPPPVNLFTRYVLENPWPVGAVLLIIGAWLIWTSWREGLMRKTIIGVGVALGGVSIIALGTLVTTAGEHARNVARELAESATAGDSIKAISLFSSEAVFTIASPKNPGMDLQFIQDQIIRLIDRYAIESNSITMLRGYTDSSSEGVVHMACMTTVADFPYPNLSRWVLHVKREGGGEWKITRLTCVSINDQTPPIAGIR